MYQGYRRHVYVCITFFTENKENSGQDIKTRIFPKSKKGKSYLETILEFEQKYKKNLKLQR